MCEAKSSTEKSATENVLDLMEKKMLRLREVMEALEKKLEVVMSSAIDEPGATGNATEEGMSAMRIRLTNHLSDIEYAIDLTQKMMERLEI